MFFKKIEFQQSSFMPIGTLAPYLGLHFGRCRVMLTSDIGFLLGLGLHLLLFGAVRNHLLEHDAFGENIVSVHNLGSNMV